MPPLSDSPVRYQPSHISTAASRILAAYLAHHRMPAVEAARLAVRVESVLTELVSGRAAEVPPPPPAEVEPAPRRARRATPAKTPRARPRPAAVVAAEEQAMFDLEAETQAEADEVAAAMPPEVQPAPAPPAPVVVVVEEEIDLLTGGPLPPATEADDQALAAVADDAPANPGKKRKRPPRPASRRRAARVAAIEQLLVEGEEPPEG